MKNIAIIPARSGSKGLPDKNIRKLAGVPLLAYSIKAARETGMYDKIFLSTDSEEYAQIGREYGADVSFLRSAETSSDKASSWDAVREVLAGWEERGERFDTVTLLQPTSPLRTAQNIREAFRLLGEKEANSVVSVCEAEHSPLWFDVLPQDLCMDRFGKKQDGNRPRQELPVYYRLNGAIYLLRTGELYKQKMFEEKRYAYIMPREESVDIDDEVDFLLAETIMKRREKQQEGPSHQ